jgi:Zn finger protein HypA/HybF involved in hydrogenase expression
MGLAVTAKCQCGVDAEIWIGGGMHNCGTTCFFPCQCEGCHNVVQVNLLAKEIRCPKCGSAKITPYDDPKLSETQRAKTLRKLLRMFSMFKYPSSTDKGGHIVAEFHVKQQLGRTLKLTDRNYRCPKCQELTLRFGQRDPLLLWD